MDDQEDMRRNGATLSRKALRRFRLKWLLMAFIPLSIALAFYYRHLQQRARIQNAYDRINALVFDGRYDPNGDLVLTAKNGNVSDNDLRLLTSIGSGEAGMGGHKVIRLDLRGSQVSDDAMEAGKDVYMPTWMIHR